MSLAPAPSAARAGIFLIAGVTGAGVMAIELASVRALAPYFGSSTEVWTAAIGVVFLALACGYAAGGAAAGRDAGAETLAGALAAGGILVAGAPLALPAIARWLLPDDLSLEDALPLLRGGALATEAALFGLPVFLLGFAEPLLVKGATRVGTDPGRAVGLVLAASTLGGLAGTFGTTYVLVPELGVRTTLVAAGAALALSAAAVMAGRRRWPGAAALVLVSGLGAVAGPAVASEPRRPGQRVLAEIDSREQRLRVVERGSGEERETWLQVNEGLDSFQAIDAPGRATPGHYFDTLALAPVLAGKESRARVVVLGAGTGSVVRSLAALVPDSDVMGFELDAAVVDLGRRYFRLGELEDGGLRMIGGFDARVGLAAVEGPFDAIVVDAYARQVEIPFHLVTGELFDLAAGKLAPGGVVAVNVSSFGKDDPVLRSIAATLASRLGPVAILPVRDARNAVVVARKGSALPAPSEILARLRTRTGTPFPAIAQHLAGPGGAYAFVPRDGDPVLTDDHAPLERLQARSLRLARRSKP